MELFKPSKKVLDMICSDGKKVLSMYEIYPFGVYDEMMNLVRLYVPGILEKVWTFYELNLEKDRNRLNIQGVFGFLTEIFYNWATHSADGTDFFSGLFLGDLGVCHGFKDENFFKKPEIKNQLENKISFKEFNKNPRNGKTSRHRGYNNIFPESDFIEVDSEKGVLYCVQLRKNLIAPKGENGSQYFYRLKEKGKTDLKEVN